MDRWFGWPIPANWIIAPTYSPSSDSVYILISLSPSLRLSLHCPPFSPAVSHLIPLISFQSLTRLAVPLMDFALYGSVWTEGKDAARRICERVRQTELLLADVSLCFMRLSATLSACHRQMHSLLSEILWWSSFVLLKECVCVCVFCEIN